MWKRLLFCGLGCALAMSAHGAFADTNNLVIGARAQGFGSAYSAISNEASATFWNPAAMTRLSRTELTYSHWTLSDVDNIGVDFAAVAVPFAAGNVHASVGFSFTRVGAQLEEGPSNATSDISDSRFGLAGAVRLHRTLSVGLSLNRLEVNSERDSGAGFGFDASLLVEPFETQDLRVGIVGRNLSADVKNEDIDQSWRFGAGYTFWESRITASAEAATRHNINGQDGVVGQFYGGLEIAPVPQFAIRGGGGSETQWGIGFGVNHRGFAFDYAYSDDDDVLGASHRVSVALAFGAGRLGEVRSDTGSASGAGESGSE